MDSLTAIVDRSAIEVPEFGLDRFQAEVLKNLHLEFFFARCRVLLTPHLRYSATGSADHAEEARLQAILGERQEQIGQLRRYLLLSLSLYSGLLETNSYDIALCNHLLIARIVEFKAHPGVYEVKLYTLPREDLVAHYSDKIYLGRDFASFDRLQRDHFGLAWIRDSLRQQQDKLRTRVARLATPEEQRRLDQETLLALEESVGEFASGADDLIANCPARVSNAGRDTLLEINSRFRELRHTLCEAEATLREAEAELIAASSDVARYVTKLRKDVTNDADYIRAKVNGRISDALNGIHL